MSVSKKTIAPAPKRKKPVLPKKAERGQTFQVRLLEVLNALGETNALLARRISAEGHDSMRQRLMTYTKGRSEPTLSVAEYITEAIGLPAAYLFASDPDLAHYLLSYPGEGWQKKPVEPISLDEWGTTQKAVLPKVSLTRKPRRPRD